MTKIKEAFDTLESARIFPLQTIQSMATRWGIHRNMVSNWRRRHKDFPAQIKGMVAETDRPTRYYPLFAVERYEQERGLKVVVDTSIERGAVPDDVEN